MNVIKTILAAALGGLFLSTAFSQEGPPVRMPEAPTVDIKNYHGGTCHGKWQYQIDLIRYENFGIRNISYTDLVFIFCPMVRDNVLSTDGVSVDVSINNVGGLLMCVLAAYDEYGNPVPGAHATASTSDVGKSILSLEITESVDYGNYGFHCELPPRATLYSYRIYEYQDGYEDMTDYNR